MRPAIDRPEPVRLPSEYPIPTVVEQTPEGERIYDTYSVLVKNRVVFIGTPIDTTLANLLVVSPAARS